MAFVRLFLLFLVIALVASFCRVPGLEFLASDAAKWVLIAGIVVLVAKAIGFGKQGL